MAKLPDAVVLPHRKKRAYLSAMLSKNELHGSNPNNRRIFLRVGHGLYLPNPALEVARGDAWIPLFEHLELGHLFEAMSPEGTLARVDGASSRRGRARRSGARVKSMTGHAPKYSARPWV
jgi:hypothetical protein